MITILFIFFAAMCNAIMDLISKEPNNSIFVSLKNYHFQRWLLADWTNKYVNSDPVQGIRTFWNIIPTPTFMWSGWYAAKTLMLFFIFIGISIYNIYICPGADIILFVLAWTFGFEFSYGYLFRQANKRLNYFKKFWI